MTAGENMARVLEATGIYKLTGNSPVDWELSAYQAGMGELEKDMARLEQELFAQTAPPERLTEWERLFYTQTLPGELPARQGMVTAALAGSREAATLSALEGLIAAAGLTGTVREENGGLVVEAEKQVEITDQEARRLLDRLLPAHLPWELRLRGTERQ